MLGFLLRRNIAPLPLMLLYVLTVMPLGLIPSGAGAAVVLGRRWRLRCVMVVVVGVVMVLLLVGMVRVRVLNVVV
jgi:hypothetical protein